MLAVAAQAELYAKIAESDADAISPIAGSGCATMFTVPQRVALMVWNVKV